MEALTALAAAGGAGIVQAAGTDVWTEVRNRVARLLGRGRPAAEQAALERLDRTGAALEAAAPEERALVAERQEASWQTRLEDFLEGLDPAEQAEAGARLRELLERVGAAAPTTVRIEASHSGVTAGGDVINHGGAIGRDFGGPVTIGGAPDSPGTADGTGASGRAGAPDRPTPPGAAPR
ncbi:hypothetical protein RMN57_07880 [Kitasatospora sp. CM 4170]|nr:hypothetical protein [Kitasatospora sp. CM 4170]WNM44639.1 hypothetical protein RMN57_07880 [Kitasatospora sp. CM 4170]